MKLPAVFPRTVTISATFGDDVSEDVSTSVYINIVHF